MAGIRLAQPYLALLEDRHHILTAHRHRLFLIGFLGSRHSAACQEVEKKSDRSRRMLEVCLEKAFPVLVLERSSLALRDPDLLHAINDRARAVMMWNIIYTPDLAHRSTLRQLERLVPPPEKRFAAMAQFVWICILTGTYMMPILPEEWAGSSV